jgi:hypothetical protein
MFVVARLPHESMLDEEEQRVLDAVIEAGFPVYNRMRAGNRQGSWGSEESLDRDVECADTQDVVARLRAMQSRMKRKRAA